MIDESAFSEIYNVWAVLIAIFLVSFISGIIGYLCGRGRGREIAGYWLGFFFPGIGCVIALFLPPNTTRGQSSPTTSVRTASVYKLCPLCGRRVRLLDRICPDCNSTL